jgi:hypothetical protein
VLREYEVFMADHLDPYAVGGGARPKPETAPALVTMVPAPRTRRIVFAEALEI